MDRRSKDRICWLILVTLMFAAAVTIFLTGCSKAETFDNSDQYSLPEGLKDCKVYYMRGKGATDNLAVVRCPNAQTESQYSVSRTDPNTDISSTRTYRAALVN